MPGIASRINLAARLRLARRLNPLAKLSRPIRAGLWVLISCLCFSAMSAIVLKLGQATGPEHLHPFEVVFFRNLFSLLPLIPWFWRYGLKGLKTDRKSLFVARGVVTLLSMLTWFYAITLMPLAEATAISFTTPLWATIAAIFVLGEKVRLRRWTALIVGFSGTMIVLQPQNQTLDLGMVIMLLSTVFSAGSVIMVKLLSRTESTTAIVAYMALFLTPASLLPAVFVWSWPTLAQFLWLAALGIVATLGHLAITWAYHMEDASALMPYDFTRLIFASIIGWVFFAQTPQTSTWIGAGVIFLSSAYIAHREAYLARQRRSNEAAATAVVLPKN
jgi:drug/metabolite transporter (DMT)-like permease